MGRIRGEQKRKNTWPPRSLLTSKSGPRVGGPLMATVEETCERVGLI